MLPLDLGTPKMKFEDPQPVRSHAVWKNSLQHNQAKGGIAEFSARALGTEALLDFSKLEIGSDQMRLSLSGKARVEVQGKEQTANLWDEVKEVPLLERSIEAANTALLGWVGIVLFRKPKVKDS